MRFHSSVAAAIVLLALVSCSAPPVTSEAPASVAPLSASEPPASVSAASVEPSASEPPPPGGRLAFLRDGELILRDMTSSSETATGVEEFIPLAFAVDSSQLVGMRLDPADPYHVTLEAYPVAGGEPTVLMEAVPHYGVPAASPDGRYLAFSSDGAAPNGLVLVDLEAVEAVQLTTDGGGAPVWSPDGATIAYNRVTSAAQSSDLYIVDVASGASRQVTNDEWEDDPFRWTDDGTAVLTTSHRGGDGTRLAVSVWQVDAADGSLTERPDLENDVIRYSLASPDGRFAARLSPQNILSLTEGELRVGDRLGSNDPSVHLTWAPNSAWLVWTSWDADAGAHDLMIVHAPDGEPMRLTLTPESESHPVWGPIRHGF
ncbi:MAG: DPP IV N-terminal domain-containing protein [Chloroflexota bacterium]|nr:DPP IV N-terminal domain-containing protein [Chloroflexota bacterium]